MDIIESNWGIANTFDDQIEINKNLKNFPELRKKIISHELQHAKSTSWIANRRVDVKTKIRFKDLFPFIRKHPKAFFQQYLPVTYSKSKDTLFFEWTLIILYTLGFGFIYMVYGIIKLFSVDTHMFWSIAKYFGMLIGIMVILYWIGKGLKSLGQKIDTPKEKVKLTRRQKQIKRMGLNPEMWE